MHHLSCSALGSLGVASRSCNEAISGSPASSVSWTAVGVAARHWPASDGVSHDRGRVPDLSTDVPDSVTPVRRRQSDVSYVPVVDSASTQFKTVDSLAQELVEHISA